jgi:itaconyl-CoA hydratase
MLSAYDCLGDNRYRERTGLDLEDFAPGQRFRHRPGVTLSQQDNADEALETLNAAMLHYDAHYAAATAWRQPLMVSTLVLQRIIGMASKTYGHRRAIMGFSEIALTAPVFGGDTLYAESEVLASEPGPDAASSPHVASGPDAASSPHVTSGPDAAGNANVASGIVTARLRAVQPDGSEIGHFTCRFAILRRAAGADSAAGQPRFAAFHLAEDGALVEQTGLFFDDLRPGDSFLHAPRRSFAPSAVLAHATRALELSPQYHDLDWATRHNDGRLVVSETFVIAQATAATTRTFGRVVANLGWYDIELPRPVHAGDTIEVESTILETRASRSRTGEGIVSVATHATNQLGETVLTYRRNLLVYRRGADSPYARAGY